MTQEIAALEDENLYFVDPKESALLQLSGASYLTVVDRISVTSLDVPVQ